MFLEDPARDAIHRAVGRLGQAKLEKSVSGPCRVNLLLVLLGEGEAGSCRRSWTRRGSAPRSERGSVPLGTSGVQGLNWLALAMFLPSICGPRDGVTTLLRLGGPARLRPAGPFVQTIALWPADGELKAADGGRTRDLKLGKLALYQLSYRRIGP